MRLLFYVLSICLSFGLVCGITTDCNYIVDYFWASVQSPTSAPSPSPSPSPTVEPSRNPTETPTPSSTALNETITAAAPTTPVTLLMTTKTVIDFGGTDYHEPDEAILKPLTFDYCYSFPNIHFYFGDFSLEYTCDSNNYLHRTIYYETLHCDSSNIEEITVKPWDQGSHSIKYVCDQPNNCDFAKIINSTAVTPSPTPAPTDSPTKSPTPAPTTSPTASPTHIGTPYPATEPTLMLSVATTLNGGIVVGGGDDGNWWEQCDGVTASQRTDTSDEIVSYFPENICVPVDLFTNVFDIDAHTYCDYGDVCTLTDLSFGWYCDHDMNQYFMGVFKDENCENLQETLIVYRNDTCIPKIATNDYFRAYWTYVECGVSSTTDPFATTNEPQEPSAPTTASGTEPSTPTVSGSVPTVSVPSQPSAPTVVVPSEPTLSVPSQPSAPTVVPSEPTVSVPSHPSAPTALVPSEPTVFVPSQPSAPTVLVPSEPTVFVPISSTEEVFPGDDAPNMLINFNFVFTISIVLYFSYPCMV